MWNVVAFMFKKKKDFDVMYAFVHVHQKLLVYHNFNVFSFGREKENIVLWISILLLLLYCTFLPSFSFVILHFKVKLHLFHLELVWIRLF